MLCSGARQHMRWHYEQRLKREAEERRERWERCSSGSERAEVMRAAEVAALEEQEREGKRRMAAGERASLTEVDVVIHQRVEFSGGSTIVDDTNVPAMVCVAMVMLEKPLLKVGIQTPDGLTLSAERAENVCRWLVEQGGVSVSRLRVGSSEREIGSLADGMPASAGERLERARALAREEASQADEAPWHIRFHVIPEIKIWDKIQFDTDSSELKQTSLPTLDCVSSVLSRHPDIRQLTIEGHCCVEGEEQPQQVEAGPGLQDLSANRAAAVKRYLVEAGVPKERLPNVVGYSTQRPCAPCDTAQNRARNRRVEFLVW